MDLNNSANGIKLDDMVKMYFAFFVNKDIQDEDYIKNIVEKLLPPNMFTDGEKEYIIKQLHSKLHIKMDTGVCVKKSDHKSWYFSAKKDIDHTFWDRYVQFLKENKAFNNNVIQAIDRSTDEIMDMLGNTKVNGNFSRRGLVIGDVQSGKTSTYTGIVNKAADAGYRVIIILTGTIEKLRSQTQSRMDMGFVGLDSNAYINDRNSREVGVGYYDDSKNVMSMTSTASDFNSKIARQVVSKLSSVHDPILFVVKKNKSVLEKLEKWLRVYNASDGEIDIPLLLIDEEADNASINTNKEGEDPTTINKAIRKLLNLFTKSSYLAFTATPFANIFINPDSTDEMLRDDLFPQDFIYSLDPPSNYIGASKIFNPNGKYNFMLHNNDDCEKFIPQNYKKEFIPNELPLSLREAIASFFIVNAIRDLRGHKKTHRTMMINISRFINVQENIFKLVDSYVREIQTEVRHYSKKGDSALEHENIKFIKTVYDKYFKDLDTNKRSANFTWKEIQENLNNSISSIIVSTVNGGNASKNLNYDEFNDDGLRIIAIGGFSLLRGLTLEGLCVSYFYRNSKMYDT